MTICEEKLLDCGSLVKIVKNPHSLIPFVQIKIENLSGSFQKGLFSNHQIIHLIIRITLFEILTIIWKSISFDRCSSKTIETEAIETEATETEAWRSKRVELFTQKSSGAIGVTLFLIGYSLPKAHKQPAYFPGSLKSSTPKLLEVQVTLQLHSMSQSFRIENRIERHSIGAARLIKAIFLLILTSEKKRRPEPNYRPRTSLNTHTKPAGAQEIGMTAFFCSSRTVRHGDFGASNQNCWTKLS